MIKVNKNIWKPLFFTILTVSCVCFIFSRSLVPGDESGEESGKVLQFLNACAEFFGFGNLFTHNFVRKCAHFTEFSLLSVFAVKMYQSYLLKNGIVIISSVLTYSLVAVVDEIIQSFVPGRACMLNDVLIDVSGGTLALFIYMFVFVALLKIKR